MSARPEYPIASISERAAYAVLAAATGIGLLVAVVAAFQSQTTDAVVAGWVPQAAIVATR